MRTINKLLLFMSFVAQIACTTTSKEPFDPDKMLDIGTTKVTEALGNYNIYNQYPRYIDHGETKWSTVPTHDWTSGFYPGVLWLTYEFTGNETVRAKAEIFTLMLREVAFSPARDHDIGFQVYPSFGNGYRLTGNSSFKYAMLSAADTLATLFNPTVGAIHSWPFKPEYEHNTIVDNMMNLELLFWAAKNGGEERLKDIAVSHAEVTQKYIVRPDNAVYHLGEFSKDGKFIRGVAHQGYADESMWARGQAWGIYGFAIAYRESGREDFLATSMRLADHFIERLPKDGVPYWDFDVPSIPDAPKDASAAAAAASGMLELYLLINDKSVGEKYYEAAVKLLESISTDEYMATGTDAILTHSTGHHPKGWEIDVPIIYGDYYYLDALLKLKRVNFTR
ncbi:MAG: glycoside hydrolase family 88 protein [Rikenellaceae bacterium]